MLTHSQIVRLSYTIGMLLDAARNLEKLYEELPEGSLTRTLLKGATTDIDNTADRISVLEEEKDANSAG